MNETNFSEAFIKANQKANIFMEDIGEPKFQIDVERKKNNSFLAVGVVVIAFYIIALVLQANEETDKKASKFKHDQ